MTIREALRAATARLEQADVPDADVDASYLLASVLKEDTLAMRINGHRALTEEQEKRKFEGVAGEGIGAENARKLLRTIMEIEKLDVLKQLL